MLLGRLYAQHTRLIEAPSKLVAATNAANDQQARPVALAVKWNDDDWWCAKVLSTPGGDADDAFDEEEDEEEEGGGKGKGKGKRKRKGKAARKVKKAIEVELEYDDDEHTVEVLPWPPPADEIDTIYALLEVCCWSIDRSRGDTRRVPIIAPPCTTTDRDRRAIAPRPPSAGALLREVCGGRLPIASIERRRYRRA